MISDKYYTLDLISDEEPFVEKDGHRMFMVDVVKDLNHWKRKKEELQAENAELKSRQLKDGDIAKIVNGVRLDISQVWGNPPQSLREIISKAVIRNLPTPSEGE